MGLKMDIKAIESIQNKEGKWLPRVEVSFVKNGFARSIQLQWKQKTFNVKEKAEDYATTHGVPTIKQKINQGVKLEELE